MSFKVEVSVYGEDCNSHGWHSNALRFPSEEMARADGSSLAGRWTAVKDWRVVGSADPVLYYDGDREVKE